MYIYNIEIYYTYLYIMYNMYIYTIHTILYIIIHIVLFWWLYLIPITHFSTKYALKIPQTISSMLFRDVNKRVHRLWPISSIYIYILYIHIQITTHQGPFHWWGTIEWDIGTKELLWDKPRFTDIYCLLLWFIIIWTY